MMSFLRNFIFSPWGTLDVHLCRSGCWMSSCCGNWCLEHFNHILFWAAAWFFSFRFSWAWMVCDWAHWEIFPTFLAKSSFILTHSWVSAFLQTQSCHFQTNCHCPRHHWARHISTFPTRHKFPPFISSTWLLWLCSSRTNGCIPSRYSSVTDRLFCSLQV